MRRETRDKVVVALLRASGFGVGVALMILAVAGCVEHLTLVALHKHECGMRSAEGGKGNAEPSDSLEEDPRWELLND